MYVYLDTSAVIKDFYMQGPKFKALWNYLGKTPHQLLLSEIVTQELKVNYVSEIKELSDNLRKKKIEAEKTVGIELAESPVDQEAATKKYDEFLHDLKKNPKVTVRHLRPSHYRGIVSRAVNRRPPFVLGAKTDHGFKDAIIWEDVREFANSYYGSDGVAFITSNVNQFSDLSAEEKNPSALHPELFSELDKPEHFHYFISVEAFLAKFGEPLNEIDEREFLRLAIDEVNRQIASGDLSSSHLEDLYRSKSSFPIISVSFDDLALKNLYVSKVQGDKVTVQANGQMSSWIVYWNPLDNEEFGDEKALDFDAEYELNRGTKSIVLKKFEPDDDSTWGEW